MFTQCSEEVHAKLRSHTYLHPRRNRCTTTSSLSTFVMVDESRCLESNQWINRLFPDLWLNILRFCPRKTICNIGECSPHLQAVINDHERFLCCNGTNCELIMILKVRSKSMVEKLRFLESYPVEVLSKSSQRFFIHFRVTSSLLLHMDFCVKFRWNYTGDIAAECDRVDKELIPRIMRFPNQMQDYLSKVGVMQKQFRPLQVALSDVDRDMKKLWNYFLETKCTKHLLHVEEIRNKWQANPNPKGLRWYMSHSGFESMTSEQKIELASTLRDILLSHEQNGSLSTQDISFEKSFDGTVEMRFVERNKTKGMLSSFFGKRKRKQIMLPLPDQFWNPQKGEFWFDGMYRCIVSRFDRLQPRR